MARNIAYFGGGGDVDANVLAHIVKQLVFFRPGILFFQQKRRQHAFDLSFVRAGLCQMVEFCEKRHAAVKIGDAESFLAQTFAVYAVKVQPIKAYFVAFGIAAVRIFGGEQQQIAPF